jgi:pyruvate/2-oxoglutarate dehydrogenase complex dihydrolipoamide acyltransferase (E2) component
MAAVGAGLATREALVAPVSGVIASAHVVAGQVVDARELVFEVVDPAPAHRGPGLRPGPAAMGGATLAVGEQRVPLRCRRGAQPARAGAAAGLPGEGRPEQPWPSASRCACSCSGEGQGHRGAAAALMKNPANQTIVWVKTAPERFEPRTVTTEPLDGARRRHRGLKAGDRVATQGATLINQVR